MNAIIRIDDLTINFGGLRAVSRVSFQVKKGDIHALIGPNGAGKTTILNMISGLYDPTAGDIRFEGRSIVGLSTHKITQLGIARTFQTVHVFKGLTVLENVMVAQHVRSSMNMLSTLLKTPGAQREEQEICKKASASLTFVGLTDSWEMDATMLHYSQKRLLEIARALATDPKLLLLDEPSAGLDETETRDLIQLIRQIRARGITVILIEHNMPLVMQVSDRICVVDFGVKIAEGTPNEIQNNSKVIEAYLGSDNDHAKNG